MDNRFPRNHTISPLSELRIITTPQASATLRVLSAHDPTAEAGANTAEVFGEELPADVDFEVDPGSRIAVFSWGGCKLQVSGAVSQEYAASNSAMATYINAAAALDSRRQLALAADTEQKRKAAPRVLITGAMSSGKSSLCQILLNYGVRRGWSPCFVELDPRGAADKPQQRFLPGMIGATVVNSTEREEPRDPICFYFGSLEPGDDSELYIELCRCLAESTSALMARRNEDITFHEPGDTEENQKPPNIVAASGLIIDAPCEPGHEALIRLVEIFNVNVVLVVDNPSMKMALAKHLGCFNGEDAPLEESELPFSKVVVLGVPKGEGVVPITGTVQKSLRRYAWKNYFLGSHEVPASLSASDPPSGHVLLTLRSTEVQFYQLATPVRLSANESGYQRIRVSPISGRDLMKLTSFVLGVSSARREEDVPRASIAQMALIESVEEVQDGGGVFLIKTYVAAISGATENRLGSKFLIVPSSRHLRWTHELPS